VRAARRGAARRGAARRRDASRARRCVRRVTTKRAQPTSVGVDSCGRAAVCPKLYSNYVLMNASRRFFRLIRASSLNRMTIVC
jgi:hypothetical protein